MKTVGLIIGIVVAVAAIAVGFNYHNSNSQIVNEIVDDERVRGPEEKSVKMGESENIAGLIITLNSFVEDYRCGTEIPNCPEAGAVVINVTLDDGSEKVTRNMASDEAPYAYRAYNISIIKIEPERKANEEIADKNVVITFRVEPVIFQGY